MRVWRIATRAHSALDGEGARLYGSRWTSAGRPAVFASATLSLAALERFVHADPDLEARDLFAFAIEIPDHLAIESIDLRDLPSGWRTYPAPRALTRIGDAWLSGARTAILSVPSVVVPGERNFVLNPRHADFSRVKVQPPEAFRFDPRMWEKRRPVTK